MEKKRAQCQEIKEMKGRKRGGKEKDVR